MQGAGTITLALVLIGGCSHNQTPPNGDPGSPDAAPTQDPADAAPQVTAQGTFSLLIYNVAGLPQGISGSDPAQNTSLISPLLNQYDWVAVQEDFSYHDDLARDASHSHQSVPMETGTLIELGDGLNRFSSAPFTDFVREEWNDCSGIFDAANDCLTTKGFAYARHTLAPGVEIDLYNLHMDAGRGDDDIAARASQVDQLLVAISSRSSGRAIIVVGDTNMKDDDVAVLQTLMSGAGLSDACRELGCPEPMRIDRIMFRSSPDLELSAESWRVDESFVDGSGEPLSDHEAIGADIHWTLR